MLRSFEQKTFGINYDPEETDNSFLSTAHIDFDVLGVFRNNELHLVATTAACGSGCRRKDTGGIYEIEGFEEFEVTIVRFAKEGIAKLKLPFAARAYANSFLFLKNLFSGKLKAEEPSISWLVLMDDDKLLQGKVQTKFDIQTNTVSYPGTMTLSGRMIIKVKTNFSDKITVLKSRKDPILKGDIHGWPPFNTKLALTNGPIEYYDVNEIDDPKAVPFFIVTENNTKLGDKPVSILEVRPEITNAEVLRKDNKILGTKIFWNDTKGLIDEGDPKITHYNIYKNSSPDDIEGWKLLASISSENLDFTDTEYNDEKNAAYVVLQAAQYSFGYKYESFFNRPTIVSYTS